VQDGRLALRPESRCTPQHGAELEGPALGRGYGTSVAPSRDGQTALIGDPGEKTPGAANAETRNRTEDTTIFRDTLIKVELPEHACKWRG